MDTSMKPGNAGSSGQPSPRTIPLAAEILGYVGGALALGAVTALLTAYWVQLGFYGRVGITLGVGLAGLLGGWAMARSKAPAATRLSQFLLFVGVVGAGAAVGFDVYEMAVKTLGQTVSLNSMFGTKAADWAWFAGFATMALVGGAVWWRRRTTMQHLAFGLGVGIGTLLLLPLLPIDGPDWGAGATIVLVGLIWGALGLRGWLPPENVALTLASLGVLGGIEMVNAAFSPQTMSTTWVLWVGLAVSVILVVASLLIKRMVFLGFGAAGIVLYAFQLIDAMFRGTIAAPIAMLIAGLLFVGMSVFVAVLVPNMTGRPAGPPTLAPTPSGELAPETTTEALLAETVEPASIPLAAEILGYVGGAFAVGAAIALMTTFWTQLGLYGRLGIAALGAIVGIVGGFLMGRQGSQAARRLEQFMLAIGTVALGFAVGVVAYDVALARFGPTTTDTWDRASTVANSVGALAAAVAGFALWWRRRTWLQLVVFSAAIVAGISTALDPYVTTNMQAYWIPGAVLISIGVLLGVGALVDFLSPANAAYAVGSLCVLMGIQNLTFSPVSDGRVPWAIWLGLVVSIAMIVASIRLRRGVLLGFGAVGVVLYSAQIVTDLFGGQIAGPMMLLVVGVVFVAMAVLVGIMLPRLSASKSRRSTEPPFGPQMGAQA